MQAIPPSCPAARSFSNPSPLPSSSSPLVPSHSGLRPPAEETLEALSHDTQNVLTSLGLYTDLLAVPGVLSQRHSHYAAELQMLAQRTAGLLHCALRRAFDNPAVETSVLSGRTPESPAPGASSEPLCDAVAVLRRFSPRLQDQVGACAELHFRLPADLPPLPVSAEALERITAHLVINAAAALGRGKAPGKRPSAGHIWISLQQRDGVARLRFEDTASGSRTVLGEPALCPETGSSTVAELMECHTPGSRLVNSLVRDSGGWLTMRSAGNGGNVATIFWTLPDARLQVLGRSPWIIECATQKVRPRSRSERMSATLQESVALPC